MLLLLLSLLLLIDSYCTTHYSADRALVFGAMLQLIQLNSEGLISSDQNVREFATAVVGTLCTIKRYVAQCSTSCNCIAAVTAICCSCRRSAQEALAQRTVTALREAYICTHIYFSADTARVTTVTTSLTLLLLRSKNSF
jgi:hypothetical protein